MRTSQQTRPVPGSSTTHSASSSPLRTRSARLAAARAEAAAARRNGLALLPELDVRPARRTLAHPRLVALLAAVVAVALVAAIFGAFGWYQTWNRQVGHQVVTPPPVFSPADQTAFGISAGAGGSVPGAGVAPIVITYHDIGANKVKSPYILSPAAFAGQMKMLHDAGYRTLSAAQFVDYAHGRYTPPSRSVVITFDDGTRGLWTYADKILAQYGFRAVSFLITGRVGTHVPYYLTWQQIERMHRSGRWDFESHSHDLHTKISTGPNGQLGSAFSRREFVNGQLESTADFTRRISADLDNSISDLTAHGLPTPRLFAWPFSDVVAGGGSDPSVGVARTQANREFDLSFVDIVSNPRPATRDMVAGRSVQRIEALATDSARSMFDRMAQMQSIPVLALDPVEFDTSWREPTGYRAPIDESDLANGVARFDARTLTYVDADWAQQRTSDWTSYTVSATATDLGDISNATVGLRVRVGSAAEVTTQVSRNAASVRVGPRLITTYSLTDGSRAVGAATHTIVVKVARTSTTVLVDGVVIARITTDDTAASRGGFGMVANRPSATVPFPALRALHVTPLSENGS